MIKLWVLISLVLTLAKILYVLSTTFKVVVTVSIDIEDGIIKKGGEDTRLNNRQVNLSLTLSLYNVIDQL